MRLRLYTYSTVNNVVVRVGVWSILTVPPTVLITFALRTDPLGVDVAAGNAVSGHTSTMCIVVWWLSPQGQSGDATTPHR